jgi:hypothetical protein
MSSTGYGGFSPAGDKEGSAHRYAYELLVGPIPKGWTVDHLCRVRACVKPEHLEAVTYGENNRRMWALIKAERTHWKCGHPATPENTYHYRYSGCLTCLRKRNREAWRRQAAQRRMVAG